MLSAIKENGDIEQIVYEWDHDHVLEMIISRKLTDETKAEHMEFLRSLVPFVRKVTRDASEMIFVVKWEGPLVIDEGNISIDRPLTVKTKKMVFNYPNVESLLLDGWR